MIHGIASLGPREQTSVKTKLGTATAHVAGGIAGGAAMAGVAWLVATPLRTLLPGAAVIVLLGMLVLSSGAHDLRLVGDRVHGGRQVPATWRKRYGHYRGFAAFGAALGAGIATFVPYAITYVLFATAAVLLPFGEAVACGALFGFTRAGAAALGSVRAPTAGSIFQRIQRMQRLPCGLSMLLSVAVLLSGAITRLT